MFNLASLQKFAPLLGLLDKRAGELTDDALLSLAKTLAGDGEAHVPLFNALSVLRDKEPSVAAAEILGSPTAMKIFEAVKQHQAEGGHDENLAFIKCPHCGQLSEHELQ